MFGMTCLLIGQFGFSLSEQESLGILLAKLHKEEGIGIHFLLARAAIKRMLQKETGIIKGDQKF